MSSSLAEALDASLELGELIQLSGGHTSRVVEHMERLALSLGAEECHPAVSSLNLSMTVLAGGQLLSGGRHAVHLGINFAALTALERLVYDTEALGLSAEQVRARLLLIRSARPEYPHWMVMLALGGSGAAFAAMFGATAVGIALTFLGTWAGAWIRLLTVKARQKPFICIGSAAFVSALIVALGTNLLSVDQVDPALAASTLFLVPGVPMLNGTADLLSAHYLNGVVRLTMSAVIVACAAVGLGAAVALVGVLL